MPQDADGSGLISLLWAVWVYWNVYMWFEQLSSPEQGDEERRDRPDQLSGMDATPSSAGTVISPSLEALVSEILRRSGAGSIDDFLNKAAAAYEIIVAAYNAGDRETLRHLISPDVYEAFSDAIAAQDARQQCHETVFSQLEPPQIVDGLIDDTHVEISVRFACELFKLSRNAAGEPIAGTTPTPCRTVDIWTFAQAFPARESTALESVLHEGASRKSTWPLVATDIET